MHTATKVQSTILKPNKYALKKPTKAKIKELKIVTKAVPCNIRNKFCGCRLRPNRNNKNIIPIWEILSIRTGSEIKPKQLGPTMIPRMI